MAIWTDYAIKENPENEDTLMLYDEIGNENKQLKISELSKKIVKDATEKQLDINTQDKTIPGAFNELYQKTEDIITGKQIVKKSEMVNGHTVNSDVPENAVFTDTIYDDLEIKQSIADIESGKKTVGNSAKVNNHTVNADVPENAVFTDTVYDDSEIKERVKNAETYIEESKRDIQNLHSEVRELKKKISIDTYDELAEALQSGTIENYTSVGDELMVNKIVSLSITSSNSNLSFTVSDEQDFVNKIGRIDDDIYIIEYKNGSWTYLEEPINTEEYGFTVTGTPAETDLVFVRMNYTQVSHTFVDFDPTGDNVIHPKDTNVKHFAVLEQTYIPDAFNFDYPESAICITPGYTLTAGKYYVYNIAESTSEWWCNYKRLYYTFEILNDIVATEDTGDIQIRFQSRGSREETGEGKGVYILTCKPYCCATEALYNSDTVTFTGQIAKPSSDYTDIRTVIGFSVDQSLESVGIIYNNLGHVCYGNNEWNVSNLRQKINSSEKKMIPQRMHKNDVLTNMAGSKGYMYGLDPRFKNLVKPCTVSIEHGTSDEFTRYQLYTCEDTVTLLSMKEMSFDMQNDEGIATKLYSKYTDNQLINTDIPSRAKARQAGGTPQDYRWSRSATARSSTHARVVTPSGSYSISNAVSGTRFAPAYIIGVANNQKLNQSAEA